MRPTAIAKSDMFTNQHRNCVQFYARAPPDHHNSRLGLELDLVNIPY